MKSTQVIISELRDLVVKMNGNTLVDHLSLTLYEGSILGVIGVNGAGKTTTIRSLLGLQAWDNGELLMYGRHCTPLDVNWKKNIAYIPDKPMLYEDLTVWEHMRWVAIGYSVLDQWEKRAKSLLQQADLYSLKHDFPTHFSKGMKQRLQIAMAQMHNATIIIADEPFSGLDPYAIAYLKETLQGFKLQNKTVIIATHDLHIADTLCDRFVFIHQGRTVASGTKSEITEVAHMALNSSLEEIFFMVNKRDNE